jgi:hypothetical protein
MGTNGSSVQANWRDILNQVPKPAKDRDLFYGGLVVLMVAILSIALTMQGWRSRIPAFDNLIYIYDAHDFLETGSLPRFGDTGSYGSYSPPGTAWLMLPGVFLFADPRLFEYLGAALLHLSTLGGLFLLGRRFFGFWCACLAVLLYGFSTTALFFAGSLWPIARPDFLVWVVYFASEWIRRRDARFFGASFAVWGLGMYVDMAILPLLFLFPILWLYYKPPLRLAPVLASVAIIFFVWFPFLQFELPRRFADIRSQVFQQPIHPANPEKSWCDASLTLRRWEDDISTPQQVQMQSMSAGDADLFDRLWNVGDKALSSFQAITSTSLASFILLLLTLGCLLLSSVSGAIQNQTSKTAPVDFRHGRLFWFAVGLILFGLLLGGLLILIGSLGLDAILQGSKRLLIEKLQKISLFSGACLLGCSWVAAIAQRFLVRLGIQIQPPERAEASRLLVIGLLVPWFLLLLLAEPGKPERFIWLWPLQSLFLAAFFTNILPRLNVPWSFMRAGLVAIVLLVVVNPFLAARVKAWTQAGWSGKDAEEIQVVDSIVDLIQVEGKKEAAIGYQIFIYPFMADYNVTNPLYKVGAEFDLIFQFKHGIKNTNQCAEGFIDWDEFRIVETNPKPLKESPREYFPVVMNEQFNFVGQFGSYQIYRRSRSTAPD